MIASPQLSVILVITEERGGCNTGFIDEIHCRRVRIEVRRTVIAYE